MRRMGYRRDEDCIKANFEAYNNHIVENTWIQAYQLFEVRRVMINKRVSYRGTDRSFYEPEPEFGVFTFAGGMATGQRQHRL